MNEETIKGEGSVSLIRENEDGSADYQFNFPPEALAALTRLGILTAIKAGIEEAECLNPDEELKQAIEELNDAKAEQLTDEEFAALADAYGKKETAQDIAILEKNIALIQRKWAGLSDEDFHRLQGYYEDIIIYLVFKLAKLKEKQDD